MELAVDRRRAINQSARPVPAIGSTCQPVPFGLDELCASPIEQSLPVTSGQILRANGGLWAKNLANWLIAQRKTKNRCRSEMSVQLVRVNSGQILGLALSHTQVLATRLTSKLIVSPLGWCASLWKERLERANCNYQVHRLVCLSR